VRDRRGLDALLSRLRRDPGPLFAAIKVAADRPPFVLPPRDGVYLKTRFREALLGRA
jgi:hypothetical protein